MASTAAFLGHYIIRHIYGRYPNSALRSALAMLNVATDGTQEASKFITTDANTNQGVVKCTEFHIGTAGSETQVNATAAEINQRCDVSSFGENVTAANVLTSADNGKTFFLNSTTEFQTTMPLLSTVTSGWRCKFIVVSAPSAASYTVIDHATDTTALIVNGITECEVDTGDDHVYSGTGATLTIKDGKAVAGDWCEVFSDGAKWYINGRSEADGGFEIA